LERPDPEPEASIGAFPLPLMTSANDGDTEAISGTLLRQHTGLLKQEKMGGAAGRLVAAGLRGWGGGALSLSSHHFKATNVKIRASGRMKLALTLVCACVLIYTTLEVLLLQVLFNVTCMLDVISVLSCMLPGNFLNKSFISPIKKISHR
jgi:hypothetical protein